MTTEVIRTEQLCKNFNGAFRLGPLDLCVGPGEIFGVLGPEGAGKTTLLKLLWGFMRPDCGRVSVFGMRPYLDQIRLRRFAGYLSQSPPFLSTLTAIQFVRLAGSFYEGWEETRARGLLDQLRVDPGLKLEKLSKGDRIKLGIVAAASHRPSLLILDETKGLDPRVRAISFVS